MLQFITFPSLHHIRRIPYNPAVSHSQLNPIFLLISSFSPRVDFPGARDWIDERLILIKVSVFLAKLACVRSCEPAAISRCSPLRLRVSARRLSHPPLWHSQYLLLPALLSLRYHSRLTRYNNAPVSSSLSPSHYVALTLTLLLPGNLALLLSLLLFSFALPPHHQLLSRFDWLTLGPELLHRAQ